MSQTRLSKPSRSLTVARAAVAAVVVLLARAAPVNVLALRVRVATASAAVTVAIAATVQVVQAKAAQRAQVVAVPLMRASVVQALTHLQPAAAVSLQANNAGGRA